MILAISGWKGSGKDTVAKVLVEKHGFVRIAFADVLKDMVADQYGIHREDLDNPEKKESPIFSMPVESKDGFSKMIHDFMIKEFRTEDGKVAPQYGDIPQLYWTPRALAILEGSIKRSARSDYWVKAALSRVLPQGNYVITDMRYKSEMDQILEHADKTGKYLSFARVERFESSPSSDPSERDLDSTEFDIYISNKGTLDELENKVSSIVKELLGS